MNFAPLRVLFTFESSPYFRSGHNHNSYPFTLNHIMRNVRKRHLFHMQPAKVQISVCIRAHFKYSVLDICNSIDSVSEQKGTGQHARMHRTALGPFSCVEHNI